MVLSETNYTGLKIICIIEKKVLHNSFSSYCNVLVGVPEGSLILLDSYMNNVVDMILNDDTLFSCSGYDGEQICHRRDLKVLDDWSPTWLT